MRKLKVIIQLVVLGVTLIALVRLHPNTHDNMQRTSSVSNRRLQNSVIHEYELPNNFLTVFSSEQPGYPTLREQESKTKTAHSSKEADQMGSPDDSRTVGLQGGVTTPRPDHHVGMMVEEGLVRMPVSTPPMNTEPREVQITTHSKIVAERNGLKFQSLKTLHRPPALLEESPDVFELLPDDYLPDYKSFCWWDAQDTLQCLPSVYLAGMPKCGTTDLYEKIMWHADMARPSHHSVIKESTENTEKEFHYWTRMRIGRPASFLRNPRRPPPSLPFYEFLKGGGAQRLLQNKELRIADGTPSLFWDLEGWEKRYPGYDNPPYTNADLIHSVTPDAKIIAIFRNPTERLLSEYIYFWKSDKTRREPRTPDTFHLDVLRETRKFNKCLESLSLRHCCFTEDHSVRLRVVLGVYICYVKDWASVFKENLLVVTMEEYHDKPVKTLLKVYKHIGLHEPNLDELVDFLQTAQTQNSNDNRKSEFGDMIEDTRQILNEFYAPYNAALSEYMGDSKFLFT